MTRSRGELESLHSVLRKVVDRTAAEKDIRVAKMRAELIDLGYSIVTTVWLNDVLRRELGDKVDA